MYVAKSNIILCDIRNCAITLFVCWLLCYYHCRFRDWNMYFVFQQIQAVHGNFALPHFERRYLSVYEVVLRTGIGLTLARITTVIKKDIYIFKPRYDDHHLRQETNHCGLKKKFTDLPLSIQACHPHQNTTCKKSHIHKVCFFIWWKLSGSTVCRGYFWQYRDHEPPVIKGKASTTAFLPSF